MVNILLFLAIVGVIYGFLETIDALVNGWAISYKIELLFSVSVAIIIKILFL